MSRDVQRGGSGLFVLDVPDSKVVLDGKGAEWWSSKQGTLYILSWDMLMSPEVVCLQTAYTVSRGCVHLTVLRCLSNESASRSIQVCCQQGRESHPSTGHLLKRVGDSCLGQVTGERSRLCHSERRIAPARLRHARLRYEHSPSLAPGGLAIYHTLD